MIIQNNKIKKKDALLRDPQGFTIIELVIVFLLVSITIGVLVVRTGTYSYWRQESFIRQLSDTIIFLHHQAVSDQAFYRMEFDLEKRAYTISTMKPEFEAPELGSSADDDAGTLTLELASILSPSMNSGTLIPPPSFPSLAVPVELPPEIDFTDIRTPRGKETLKTGEKPFIMFSPRGFSEFAVVHLITANEEPITILINPFSGNTTIFREYKDFEWTYGRNKKGA